MKEIRIVLDLYQKFFYILIIFYNWAFPIISEISIILFTIGKSFLFTVKCVSERDKNSFNFISLNFYHKYILYIKYIHAHKYFTIYITMLIDK